jgi:hypothetical protein
MNEYKGIHKGPPREKLRDVQKNKNNNHALESTPTAQCETTRDAYACILLLKTHVKYAIV